MRGYKVFNPDWTCRKKQYSCPGIFEQEGKLKICKNGIHFCKDLRNCFNYYEFNPNNKVAEIEAIGEIIEDKDKEKCCTSKIKIIRELSWYEVLDLVNIGNYNTGFDNTGDYNSSNHNTGDCNSGHYNSGNYNTGDRNTGNYNTGYYNTGHYNSGNCNTGNHNSGNYNTGNRNSGNYNTGNRNSGYYNSGDCNFGRNNFGDCNTGRNNFGNHNTGHWNSGNYNTGKYNSGNYNSGNYNSGCYNTGDYNAGSCNIGNYNAGNGNFGCFNTGKNKMIFFNKQSDWTYEDWEESKAKEILDEIEIELEYFNWISEPEMTRKEKEEHPEYKTIKGYLKFKEKEELYSLRQKWWKNLSEKDKETILNLPNFDANIFKEITGIDITNY